MAREGFDTYAFDGSKSAVEKTMTRIEQEHLSAHLCVSDALNLDYPDNYFDAIIDNFCIYGSQLKWS